MYIIGPQGVSVTGREEGEGFRLGKPHKRYFLVVQPLLPFFSLKITKKTDFDKKIDIKEPYSLPNIATNLLKTTTLPTDNIKSLELNVYYYRLGKKIKGFF